MQELGHKNENNIKSVRTKVTRSGFFNKKFDIRQHKTVLREKIKEKRRSLEMSEKSRKDRRIRINLFTLPEYKNCEIVITYISTPIEVDTRGIIMHAWRDGKKVVVPRCIKGTKNMEFFEIKSFNDVQSGTFGVLEPTARNERSFKNFENSICIVPALSYDLKGYRLGYGGGYYDRFLSSYNGKKIGIIYDDCISHKLIHGWFDVPVDMLISEKNIHYV